MSGWGWHRSSSSAVTEMDTSVEEQQETKEKGQCEYSTDNSDG